MPRRWAAWGAMAVLVAAVAVLIAARRPDETRADARAPAIPARPTPAVARRLPAGPPQEQGQTVERGASLDGAEIAAALDEELVPLASSIRILELAADEERLCAGRPVWLRARFEGATEPVVGRFLWRTPQGLALEPGTAARWTPDAAGPHEVRFQVVRSLVRKRVGLMAERTMTVQVDDCTDKPVLWVEAKQDRDRVELTAMASVELAGGLTWDFGDGKSAVTSEPRVRHEYPIFEIDANEVRNYRVSVKAHARDGAPLSATTNVVVRGLPDMPEPELVTLELGESVWDDGAKQWRRTLEVHNRSPSAIVWEAAERRTHWDDGHLETRALALAELGALDSRQGRGGFAGQVRVDAFELAPGVRAIVDTLRGRDETGAPVTLTWVPYDREDVAEKPPLPPARQR